MSGWLEGLRSFPPCMEKYIIFKCIESQEALSELGDSSAGSPKGNPILPCFCKYHASLCSQWQKLGYNISLCQNQGFCLGHIFPWIPHRYVCTSRREFSTVQTLLNKSQQLLPELMTKSSQQLHPVEVGSSPYFLLFLLSCLGCWFCFAYSPNEFIPRQEKGPSGILQLL